MIGSQHGYLTANKEKGTEMTWNGDRGMNYFKFIIAPTMTENAHYWNMSVHNWLKYYVYMRFRDRSIPPHKLQGLTTFKTYLISSMWHGLDPGFFCFFIAIGMLDILARLIKTTKLAHQI